MLILTSVEWYPNQIMRVQKIPLELDVCVCVCVFFVVEAYMSECVNENANLETDPMKCLDTLTAAIFQHKLLHLAAKPLS